MNTMMNLKTNWQTQTIGDIVARLPRAAALFQAHRIDFCCGGQRPLGEAIQEQNLDAPMITTALDRLAAAQTNAGDFLAMGAAELTDYIESRHHTYLRDVLPHITELFNAVLKPHGANHPELFRAHAAIGRLRTDLEQHLVKEEVQLFPELGEGNTRNTAALAAQIVAEHEAAGALLKQLRALLDDYTAPEDACRTYRLLLEELANLEADLFQHIHLENNILLKDIGGKGENHYA